MTLEEMIEYHRRRTPYVNAEELLKLKKLDAAAIPVPDRTRLPELFPSEDEITPLYFHELAKSTQSLTPGEEARILELVYRGDEEAGKRLIEHYLPLVVAIAWEYEQCRQDFLGRIEEGNRHLMTAVEDLARSRQENAPAYIADRIRQGVYRFVWESGQFCLYKDLPMEQNLDQILDLFSPQDQDILRELARAEDREQRLLKLAVEHALSPKRIDLTWSIAIRRSRKLLNQKDREEDS